MKLREKLAITIQSGLQLNIPMSELLDAVLEDVREAAEEAKPKEQTIEVEPKDIYENMGYKKALSDYHKALMEVLK